MRDWILFGGLFGVLAGRRSCQAGLAMLMTGDSAKQSVLWLAASFTSWKNAKHALSWYNSPPDIAK